MPEPRTPDEILDVVTKILLDLLEISHHDVKLTSNIGRDLGAYDTDFIAIYQRILLVCPAARGKIAAFSAINSDQYTVLFICELLAKHLNVEWPEPTQAHV